MDPIQNYISQRIEKKNKKKSTQIAIMVHVVLILLLLIPFFNMQSEEDLPTVFIQFEDVSVQEFAAASESSSSDEAASEEAQESTRPEPMEFNPVEAAPSSPILTSESDAPSFSEVKDVNVKIPIPTTDALPSKEISTSLPSIQSGTNIKAKTIEVLEYIADESVDEGEGHEGQGNAETGDDSEMGQSGSADDGKIGNSKSGEKKGKENGSAGKSKGTQKGKGKGNGNSIFDGDGVLTRRIIKRPNLNSLIAQSGKMSVDVCVNRQGKVTYARYNPDFSTIRNRDLIKKALNASDQYVFESKANAPRKECGRLTINIIIE